MAVKKCLRRFTKAGSYDDTRYLLAVLSGIFGGPWRTYAITNMMINLSGDTLTEIVWSGYVLG